MTQYVLRVIDFETTGIPSDDEKHSVVEAAYLDIDAETKTLISNRHTLVKPETPMDIRSLAVHHITEEEASQHGMSWLDVKVSMQVQQKDQEVIYVAHNANFEKQFFDPPGFKWIDTYKVALYLYPDAPSHSNQVMKYYLGIKDNEAHHPPHRALPDCFVTAEIILKMSDLTTFSNMIKISKQPPYFTRLTFGKHKGMKYEEAPTDYLQWLVRQQDMDEGVIAAANRALHHGKA